MRGTLFWGDFFGDSEIITQTTEDKKINGIITTINNNKINDDSIIEEIKKLTTKETNNNSGKLQGFNIFKGKKLLYFVIGNRRNRLLRYLLQQPDFHKVGLLSEGGVLTKTNEKEWILEHPLIYAIQFKHYEAIDLILSCLNSQVCLIAATKNFTLDCYRDLLFAAQDFLLNFTGKDEKDVIRRMLCLLTNNYLISESKSQKITKLADWYNQIISLVIKNNNVTCFERIIAYDTRNKLVCVKNLVEEKRVEMILVLLRAVLDQKIRLDSGDLKEAYLFDQTTEEKPLKQAISQFKNIPLDDIGERYWCYFEKLLQKKDVQELIKKEDETVFNINPVKFLSMPLIQSIELNEEHSRIMIDLKF